MSKSLRIELPHLILIATLFVLAAISWSSAPERIPVHWNLQGQIDRYGGKIQGLLLLPVIALGVYLLMRFLPRLDPGRANYAQFAGPYAVLRFTILAFLAVVYVLTILQVRGFPVRMERMMPFFLGVLFVVMGGVLGKVRPNWFVGIRTPWTLSSKESWVKTHRVGGWLFMITGLLTLIAAFVHPVAAIVAGIGGSLASTLVLLIYSYSVWRQDPDKLAAAGTLPADES